MLIAKAIYDNEAETNDELSFDREDILAVLEQDYNGMEGWWLCSLRGKTGIAPSNRLLVIHKIDVKSSSAAVKGPRFPSEELRPMDYDFPKPVVPRKIGGSFDNLLTISEDDCYRGVGGGQVSRSGGSTPYGRLETQASLARKRGVSVDNLVNSSNFTEYAVPVSLSPNDYEVPKNNYGKKASNRLDKSSSGKEMTLSSMSSKDSQRPKNTSDQTYETPKGPPDRHPRNLPVPELKLWDRDSCLADYDTPTSSAKAASLDGGMGAKYPVGKSQVAQQPAGRSAETQAKSSGKAQKCDIDPALLTSLNEVRSAVMQITSYADKWRACANPTMKLSIVKQVCVAVWKKLQALIMEFSKYLAKFKGRALSPLADRLGSIKVVTAELEKILNYISSSHPNEIHQGGIDYVTELVRIAKDIEDHLDYCSSFFNSDLGDVLDCPNKTSKNVSFSRLSSSDDPPSEAEKRKMQQRRAAPALPPPRIIARQPSENYSEDDFSISSISYNAKTPTYGRSFSFDLLSSDYDTPRSSSSIEVGSSPNHGFDKMAPVLRSSGARSADVGRTKRNAIVVEKSRESFDILQRRNPNSQIAPSKLITGRANPDRIDQTDRLDISNTAEYDYPSPPAGDTKDTGAYIQNSRGPSRDLEEPITAYDKRMLVFFSERLNTELSQLKGSCQAVSYGPAETTSEGQRTLSAQIQSLVISAHKLVFVADTLIKKLTGGALKKQLQRQALEIIDKTKSIAFLAKSSLVSGWNSNRQQLLEVTDNLLAAAITFQNIVIKGSKL